MHMILSVLLNLYYETQTLKSHKQHIDVDGKQKTSKMRKTGKSPRASSLKFKTQ